MQGSTHRARAILGALYGVAILALTSGHVRAESVADFYKGKTITLVISSAAGGGFDAYSRLLSRHIARHIPGQPGIVVQNMPGAGSLRALNYIANVAPHDGTVISDADSTMPFYKLLEGENAKFDPYRLNWIGSISKADFVCVAFHDRPFKTIEDAMKTPLRVSGSGAAGWRIFLPRLYNIVAGTKFQVIMGYNGAEALLAMERGEVDGNCPAIDTLSGTKPDWLRDKKLTFLIQFALEAAPELKDVPLAIDHIKNPDDRAAMQLILSQQLTGRPYVAPPDVPADRLAALREAFDETMKDPEFLADAERVKISVNPLSSVEMKALLDRAYGTPPAVIAHARDLSARANAPK
jgi:tripartite-type tricarboxylate transporter receptor subunit TctC